MRKSVLISSVLAAVFISGCSGDDNSTTNNSSSAENTSVNKITGRVIDGYIDGATVFLDINGNGILDEQESRVTSNSEGEYSIPIDTTEEENATIVAVGGFDTDTNSTFKGKLKAPAGEPNITPATTLITEIMEQNLTKEEAKQRVAELLSVDVEDISKDPIAVANETDNTNLLKANLKIQKSLELIKDVSNKDTDSVITELAKKAVDSESIENALEKTSEELIVDTETKEIATTNLKKLHEYIDESTTVDPHIAEDEINQAKDEFTKDTNNKVESSVEEISQKIDDSIKQKKSKTDKSEEAQSKTDEAQDKANEAKEDANKSANDKTEESKKDAEDSLKKAQDKSDEAKDKAEKIKEEAQDKSDSNRIGLDIKGKVVDGYIKDAKVCLDINNNERCDDDEPTTISDENGSYHIYSDKNISIKSSIIAYGGTDIDSDEPFKATLKTSIKSKHLTPLSTLVQELMSTHNISEDKAKDLVANALDIDTNSVLEDPIMKLHNGEELLLKANLKVLKVAELVAELNSTSTMDKNIKKIADKIYNNKSLEEGIEELDDTTKEYIKDLIDAIDDKSIDNSKEFAEHLKNMRDDLVKKHTDKLKEKEHEASKSENKESKAREKEEKVSRDKEIIDS